jgi:DNA-binding response OmpR family regulator
MNPQKIVIVEDEQLLANALSLKLKKEGFETFIASNGQEGLDVITAQKPQLVLLDLMMPVMDGKTMLKHLREIPQFAALPVIVLTNAGEVDNITQTQRYLNAAAFLIKSNVSVSEIISTVKRMLSRT